MKLTIRCLQTIITGIFVTVSAYSQDPQELPDFDNIKDFDTQMGYYNALLDLDKKKNPGLDQYGIFVENGTKYLQLNLPEPHRKFVRLQIAYTELKGIQILEESTRLKMGKKPGSRILPKAWIDRHNQMPKPAKGDAADTWICYSISSILIAEGYLGYQPTENTEFKTQMPVALSYYEKAITHLEQASKFKLSPDERETCAASLKRAKSQHSLVKAFLEAKRKSDAVVESVEEDHQNGPTNTPKTSGAEIERFRNHFKGKTRLFKVVSQDDGGYASIHDIILEDAATRKKFSIGYTYGLGKSLGVKSGESVSVRFSASGEPASVKNESNGVGHQIERWKVTGFGW